MPDPTNPRRNCLLAALPASDWPSWRDNLELVDLSLGQTLFESGQRFNYAYFPTTAVVALLYLIESGASTEIALVGNDGIVGVSLFMGGETTTSRAVVQSAGLAYRISSRALITEFNRFGPGMHLLLRYTQALIAQMAQTAVCNRHHTLEQQLCRWILLTQDRLEGNTLTVTQELVANLLGVRRAGITEAMLKLHHAGVIRHTRGQITILDRQQLEAHACECYAIVQREYARLLPGHDQPPELR